MGIPTLQCDGYEGDDIIATVASQCEKAGRNCRILSGDKDLMQLVTETTQILKPDHADVWKVIGREGVKAEWGVYPEKMPRAGRARPVRLCQRHVRAVFFRQGRDRRDGPPAPCALCAYPVAVLRRA